MFEIALFIVVGIFAGILAGLLGVGGGSIIVPTLFFVFSWLNFPDATNIQMAIATSLACIVITSISSTISHNKKDGVRWDVFIVLSIGIPIGAFIGVNFIYLVSDLLLKLIIAVFIIYVGISSFSNKKSEFIQIKSSAPKNIVVGSIIGLLSIPLGIGGGSFCVPYLRMLGFDIRRAIGTSLSLIHI